MASNKRSPNPVVSGLRSAGRRVAPFAGALFSTLLSLPTVAVTIPNVPLQSGSAYPPANIMFILDDSGSMAFPYMPDNVPDVTPDRIENLAYPRNSLSYDPAVDYLSWRQANTDNSWSRVTGGMTYDAAYSSFNFAGPGNNTIDLGNSGSCRNEDYNGTATAVCGGVQTFYVPKDLTLPLTDPSMANTASYWRYQLTSGGASVVRAEFGPVVTSTATSSPTGFPTAATLGATTDVSGNGGNNVEYAASFVVPAGIDEMYVTSTGGTHGTNGGVNNNNGNGADLYVKRGSSVAVNNFDCNSTGGSNDEACTLATPTAGTWSVGLNRASSFAGVQVTVEFRVFSNNRCAPSSGSPSWINCTSTLPNAGRNLAQEKINYATWFSYYRTRMKLAKAGASEAFSQIGSNVRVGYDSIWNRAIGSNSSTVATTAVPTYKIPVATDSGLFRDQASPVSTNRTEWYNRLMNAKAYNGTPLKGALQRSGEYYKDTTATGPWGPETGVAQLSCRQSFAILTTDGYWNDNAGYTAVGDADSDPSTSVSVNPVIVNTAANKRFQYLPETPFMDNPRRSDTLADVAMNYWKRDLVSTLPNDVPESSADPAWWQHMSTFGISIGLQGTLDPTDLQSISDGSVNWPNPLDVEDNERIDDLWHAAVNGHGSFVAAKSPAAFARALTDSLSLIAARRGSASNVATNSTSFQSDTRVFQARYWSGRWTGELAAYAASSAGIAPEPAWQASQGIPAPGSRNILTWNGAAGAAFPTAAQVTALDQSSRPLSPVNGTDNAAYLRGDASNEVRMPGVGHTLRTREITIRSAGDDIVKPTPLGDIVNSTPIYVQELQTLFVGANDGMMHAFNAVTGAERFAYVPGAVNLGAMATLSDPNYIHTYLVDGPIAVTTTAQTPGHNYLVGSLGRGGKGLYSLDVYSSDQYAADMVSASDVKWERTTGANMGNILGEPLMVTLNDGSKGVIVGNGINSTSGKAVLFILDVVTGAILKEIDTGVAGGNGMSAPRGWDNDGNGTVDYVYAGDLKGNVWKFDLTATSPGVTATTGWKVALSGSPLFTATDAANNPQPITAGLALGLEPVTSRRWVFVGTGKFLEQTDVTTTTVQSMYGIIDEDATVTGRTSTGDGNLQKRQIVVAGRVPYDTDGDGDLDGINNTTGVANGSDVALRDVRGFEANAPLPSAKKGWYIDLVTPPTPTLEGERIVSNPRLSGTVLITASLIPPTDNTCDAGGRGFINALDAFTGSSLTVAYFNANGTVASGVPNFADDTLPLAGNNIPIGSIDLGLGMPTLPTLIDKLLVAGGSKGTTGSVAVNPQGSGARRVSWREILKD